MSQQESFSKEFQRLRALGKETFVLRGSTVIVEVLPPEELKTASGLVVATTSDHVKGGSVEQHKIQTGRVLMVGEGYQNEDGSFEPLEVQPGAIVMLPPYSTQYLSMFPGIRRPTGSKIAMVKASEILGYYPTHEAYERAKTELA